VQALEKEGLSEEKRATTSQAGRSKQALDGDAEKFFWEGKEVDSLMAEDHT